MASEWYEITKKFLNGFNKWAKFDKHSYNAAFVMWMGWCSRNLEEIAKLTKIPFEDVEYFADRAYHFNIWLDDFFLDADNWPGFQNEVELDSKQEFEMGLCLVCDCLTVAGIFDRHIINGEKHYQNAHPFLVGDKVKSKSGKGSWFYVCDIKNCKDGPMIKMGRTLSKYKRDASRIQWRPASNYKIVEKRHKTKPDPNKPMPPISYPESVNQEQTQN